MRKGIKLTTVQEKSKLDGEKRMDTGDGPAPGTVPAPEAGVSALPCGMTDVFTGSACS